MRAMILMFTLVLSFNGYCDTETNLTSYFNSLGYNTKINNPVSYRGQSAFYFSGGEVNLKNHVTNLQATNIQLPGISAGCGGIDILGGGLSFINSDKLKEFANAVAHNMAGLAADLAIQTLTPQFHAVLTKFQDWAQKINGFNLNSCETARAGISAIKAWAGTDENNKVQCEQTLVDSNQGSWADAKTQCNSDPMQVLLGAKNDAGKKEIILVNKNIAWDELQKFGFLQSDPDLAEFFMSITGTIVYDAKGDKKTYPSLFTPDGSIVNALLNGGSYQDYHCDDDKLCLNPTVVSKTLSSGDSLTSMVKAKIQSLVVSLQNDVALTDDQKSFLEMTSLPVLRLMASILEQHVNANLYISSYAEVISVNILQKYLSNVLTQTDYILAQSITSPNDIYKLQQNVRRAQTYVSQLPLNAMARLNQLNQLVKQRKEVQKTIQADMNNYLINGDS